MSTICHSPDSSADTGSDGSFVSLAPARIRERREPAFRLSALPGNKRVLAIVPARAGSSRLPHKNLSMVGRESLLERTLRFAYEHPLVTDVVVSTDCERTREYAFLFDTNWSVLPATQRPLLHVVWRPAQLAKGQPGSMYNTVGHALNEWRAIMGWSLRVSFLTVLLQPTSPFRNPDDLAEALRAVANGWYENAVSVAPVHRLVPHPSPASPSGLADCNGNFWVFWGHDGLPVVYDPETCLYVKQDTLYSLQVDTPADLELVRAVARGLPS